MWLITRLFALPETSMHAPAVPPGLPDAPMRRLALKRSARAGRAGLAPWHKVAAAGRRRTH